MKESPYTKDTWHVGQEVLVRVPKYRGDSPDTEGSRVSKVGRKYLSLEGDRFSGILFDIKTGISKGESNYPYRVYPSEACYREAQLLSKKLRTLYSHFSHTGWLGNLSSSQIDDILCILGISVKLNS